MEINNQYYLISAKHSNEVASAYAPKGTKLAHEMVSEIETLNQLPFDLNLNKLSLGMEGLLKSEDLSNLKKIWLDYLPNSFAWPLMSSKLKMIIENNLSGKEGIDWIQAIVKTNTEHRVYYIPRFIKKLDVLNIKKTMFVPGTDHIIKPIYSLSKIEQYSVFHKPSSFWQITAEIYICGSIKEALEKEKVSGLCFEKTPIQ